MEEKTSKADSLDWLFKVMEKDQLSSVYDSVDEMWAALNAEVDNEDDELSPGYDSIEEARAALEADDEDENKLI